MRTNQVRYPLAPAPARFKQPNTVYLNVETDPGGVFLVAHGLTDDNPAQFDNPDKIGAWLRSLPINTWVITYHNDYIPALFPALIQRFKISAYGEYCDVLTLINSDNKKIYLISAFQFFSESLQSVCQKLSIGYEHITGQAKQKDLFQYSQDKVFLLSFVWSTFIQAVNKVFGVHPSKTPGATALKTWRSMLPRPLFVKGNTIRGLNYNAISAGAVHWQTGYYPMAYKYDINAAYPFVMSTLRFPFRLTAFCNRPPSANRWIATVRINYKCNRQFSPLSIRLDDNSITHPDRVTGALITLTYIDYKVLSLCGEVDIIEWLEGVYWSNMDETDLFSPWVDRVASEIRDHPENKILLKIFTRALHSKFAQKPGAPMLELRLIDPGEILTLNLRDIYPLENGQLAAAIIDIKPPRFQPYIHPEFEALTQAGAKLLVYSTMDENTVYMDTDCIISTQPRPDLSIGPEFGQWKIEGYGKTWIAGPRMYAIETKVKSSGIRPVDYKELHRAIQHAAIGRTSELKAIEYTSLIDPLGKNRLRSHEIKPVKYPYVEIEGLKAMVTASPTVEKYVKTVRRLFSIED